MSAPVTELVERLAHEFLHAEAEQTVRDLAHHVGDEIHVVLARHGMTMKTTAGAIGVGVLAAAQVLGDTLEFAKRSMDGDAEDERAITAAVAKLFADVVVPDLALTASAATARREALEEAARVADVEYQSAIMALRDTGNDSLERSYRRGRGEAGTAIGVAIRQLAGRE